MCFGLSPCGEQALHEQNPVILPVPPVQFLYKKTENKMGERRSESKNFTRLPGLAPPNRRGSMSTLKSKRSCM